MQRGRLIFMLCGACSRNKLFLSRNQEFLLFTPQQYLITGNIWILNSKDFRKMFSTIRKEFQMCKLITGSFSSFCEGAQGQRAVFLL